MPRLIMALGPVVFRDFEVPPEVGFGGRQRLAVHRLAGGGRIIDYLGRDDEDIRFSGTFAGPDASLRARLLDTLRTSGVAVPLTWDVFLYTVMVREFKAMYQNEGWIPYQLRCVVVRDESDSVVQTISSLASVLSDDLAAAGMDPVLAGSPQFSDAMSAAQGAEATVPGTENYRTAQARLGMISADLNRRLQVAQQTPPTVGFPDGSTSNAADGLYTATQTAEELALVTRARGYIGNAIVNLANQGART